MAAVRLSLNINKKNVRQSSLEEENPSKEKVKYVSGKKETTNKENHKTRTKSDSQTEERKKSHLVKSKSVNNEQAKQNWIQLKKTVLQSQSRIDTITLCTLCSRILKEAKMLPCQHTFCFNCLNNIKISDKSSLSCPTCGEEVAVPEGGLSQLPANLAIQTVLDAVKTLQKLDDKKCTKCADKLQQASSCAHCHKKFCPLCWPNHLSDLNAQTQDFLQQLLAAEKQLVMQQEDFEKRCEKIEEQVDTSVNERIQKLREEQKKMKEDIKELKEREKNIAEKIENELDSCKKQLEDRNTQTPNTGQWIISFNILKERCSRVLHEIQAGWQPQVKLDFENLKLQPAVSRDGEEVIEIPLSPILNKWDKKVMLRGSITHSNIHHPGGILPSPWCSQEIFIVAVQSAQVYVFNTEGALLRSIGKQGPGTGEFLCPSAITASQITNEIFVSDKWRHCVVVFDKNGRFVREIGRKGKSAGNFRSPEGMAISSSRQLFVCDTYNDRVQILTLQGEVLGELGTSPQEHRAFSEPTDVSITPNGEVVVCDSGNKRIKIYSAEGRHLNTFGNTGTMKKLFKTPTCVAVDKDYVYVGDSGTGKILVHNFQGNMLRSFGNFFWLKSIAVSPSNDIIASDYKTGKVKFFTTSTGLI